MTSKPRVDQHRRRMRERGFRPIQMWVPDVRTAVFAAEAKRQAHVVALADASGSEQAFIDAVAAPWDDE